MALRDILPQVVQPFRYRSAQQEAQPICLGPLDILQLMEFVERNSRRKAGNHAPGALAEDAPKLVPEPGFRY